MAPLIPTLAAHARSIISSAVTARTQAVQTASTHLSQVGPLAARAILLARDDNNDDNKDQNKLDPSVGVTDPNNINNTGIFVLFGLIGVGFVLTGIWFFFWAKNGGFYFKQDDWEDYKSTVLRRRGPNGTLLSNATPSTNLGGGSVYKDVYDDGATEYTGRLTQMTHDTGDTMSTLTGITAGPSDIAGRERRRKKREKKEREHEKKRDRKNKSRRKVGEDGVLVDEEAEADAKRNLRAYRHERAARVGGLNKEAEGSEWEGSTNPEMSTVSGGTASELLLNNRQSTPTSTPTKEKRRSRKDKKREEEEYHDDGQTEMTYESNSQATQSNVSSNNSSNNNNNNTTANTTTRKAGGIRKVYSTADRTTKHENERLRAEARRLAEKGRAAASSSSSSTTASSYHGTHRRDFSYQRADLRNANSAIAEEPQETGSLMQDHHNRYLPPPSGWVPGAGESDIGDGSDLGTKSYRHYIPGLSSIPSGSAVDSSVGGGESEYSAAEDEIRRERRRKREERRARRD
ncbi:hypothetical protein F5Y03DRAFT_155595 [Xylaria venustula]|nr:hypothetical protein F5Y03DRAFT_155595 [Xylaria venustula]